MTEQLRLLPAAARERLVRLELGLLRARGQHKLAALAERLWDALRKEGNTQ